MATTTVRRLAAAALCLGFVATGCQGTPPATQTPTKLAGVEPRVADARRESPRSKAPAVANIWPEPNPPPAIRDASAQSKSAPVGDLSRGLAATRTAQNVALSADTVRRVGVAVATAAGLPNVTVEVLSNKRPTVERTSGGNLFVSTGMLAQLRDENDLAALVALQLAPQVKDDVAQPVSSKGASSDRDTRIATRLLGQAGYSAASLATIKERLGAKPVPKTSLMAN